MVEKLNKEAVYRAAKPKESNYILNDDGGLYLLCPRPVQSYGDLFIHLTVSEKKCFGCTVLSA